MTRQVKPRQADAAAEMYLLRFATSLRSESSRELYQELLQLRDSLHELKDKKMAVLKRFAEAWPLELLLATSALHHEVPGLTLASQEVPVLLGDRIIYQGQTTPVNLTIGRAIILESQGKEREMELLKMHNRTGIIRHRKAVEALGVSSEQVINAGTLIISLQQLEQLSADWSDKRYRQNWQEARARLEAQMKLN
jgi:hypothetical protein